MNFGGIKIIVFDLDDTLYPEWQFVKSGFQAVCFYLQETGLTKKNLFSEMWRCFSQGTRGTVFNDVLHDAGICFDGRIIERLVEVYRSHTPSLSLYPDAGYILSYFYSKKMIGLLTDGPVVSQKGKIASLGIRKYFDIIVFTNEFGRRFWKPNTAGYKKIMTRFYLSADECLYIGDNPKKDFYGARKLGWKTVQVIREDGQYKDEKNIESNYKADVIVKDLYKIESIIS